MNSLIGLHLSGCVFAVVARKVLVELRRQVVEQEALLCHTAPHSQRPQSVVASVSRLLALRGHPLQTMSAVWRQNHWAD